MYAEPNTTNQIIRVDDDGDRLMVDVMSDDEVVITTHGSPTLASDGVYVAVSLDEDDVAALVNHLVAAKVNALAEKWDSRASELTGDREYNESAQDEADDQEASALNECAEQLRALLTQEV